MLHCYLFFHCNLAFSSIEEEQRPHVIDHCYTPMLDLAEQHGIPVGVELTGWTLEQIALLRPEWVLRFKRLLASNSCELIGSGYAQIIGPLVPAAANAANQKLGQATYAKLLNCSPTLALINEQAYSPGILEHYAEAGYTSVIMEWDNPRLANPQWPPDFRYAPQKVQDMTGRELGLLWNQSVLFQHLQRFVHGELPEEAYLACIGKHKKKIPQALCVYGNDAEIFDFRPGRFETEAPVQEKEWQSLGNILKRLRQEPDVTFCLPSEILGVPIPHSGNLVQLESPGMPVPVKKQPKYNLLRWAVTGRDDFAINSRCRALTLLLAQKVASPEEWKELCELWASDFRTHITEKRWNKYLTKLAALEAQMEIAPVTSLAECHFSCAPIPGSPAFHTLQTSAGTVRLNLHKGMAIDAASFTGYGASPLFGTLPHGFFDNIALAADFFTGHTVMEIPGQRKRTDLAPVFSHIGENENSIFAAAEISSFYCTMQKKLELYKHEPRLDIHYTFHWTNIPLSSIRLLHLTLFPDVFNNETLFYATHNGGGRMESHALQKEIDHGHPVSFLVSARHGLGMTEGCIVLGDKDKQLRITVSPPFTALVGMITHQCSGGACYTRLVLSMRECDDTAQHITSKKGPVAFSICIVAERAVR